MHLGTTFERNKKGRGEIFEQKIWLMMYVVHAYIDIFGKHQEKTITIK
jgi:hypothetical protein